MSVEYLLTTILKLILKIYRHPQNKQSRSSLNTTLGPLKQRHTLIHTSAHTRTLDNETEGLLSVVPPSQ